MKYMMKSFNLIKSFDAKYSYFLEGKKSSYRKQSCCQSRWGPFLTLGEAVFPIHFQSPTFVFFLQNTTAGTRITIINATDKDEGRNAEIKFTIISGNDDGKFLLNETSGELFTAGILDYDTAPNSYKVK